LTKNIGIDLVAHVGIPIMFEDSVKRDLLIINNRRMKLSYTDPNESTNEVIGKTYEEILSIVMRYFEYENLFLLDDYSLVIAYAFSLVFIDHESSYANKSSETRSLLLKLSETMSKELLSQCIDTTTTSYIKFNNIEKIESIIYDTIEEINSIKNPTI
jgi:hypothetical protein